MRNGLRRPLYLLLLTFLLWKGAVATGAAATSLKVQMYNGNTAAVSNNILPRYKLTNTGSTAIDLSKVKIRYYYTIDSAATQNFQCDRSTIGPNHVTGTFGKPDPVFTGADTYFEMGFTANAGLLKPRQSIEIHNRITNTGRNNYNQSNDYSFNANARTYGDWNKITVALKDDAGDTPVTIHDYTNDGEWVNQPVTIHLNVVGDRPGVSTYYQIDAGTIQSGRTIIITEDGVNTVSFWSVYRLGQRTKDQPSNNFSKASHNGSGQLGANGKPQPINTNSAGFPNAQADLVISETPQTITVKLDTVLPAISDLQPADSTTTTNQTPTFAAALTDSLSGIDSATVTMTVDGAAVTGTYDDTTGKVTYTPNAALAIGSHTFTITVADLAGNQATTASSTFTIADITPVTSHDYTHDGEWVNQPVTINLTVFDASTGVTTYYKIDGGTTQTGNTITITTDGIHMVSFWSVTAYGTTETARTLTVKLDQTLPTITSLYPADAASLTATTPTFAAVLADSLSGNDASTVALTVDGAVVTGTYDTTTSKVTYTPSTALTVGSHTFTATVADLAGNQATAGSTFAITSSGSDVTLPSDPATVAPTLDTSIVTGMQAATSFLYTGDNPIQSDVEADTIVARQAAVIRGKVLDADGNALSGVKITILNHYEYGYTYSRADGMFDMAVNGGGYLTVKYAKSGYISVQRQVNVPWQNYVWADEARLIAYDTKVTMIAQDSSEGQLARGSVTSDDRGERQATLFFPAGTTISGVSGDTVSVRATEFTVGTDGPKKMPAALPATSAYTYCVDLSVDDVSDVEFSQPIYFYVDNFLNFPVGGNVPTGYYDTSKGVWVPSDNGVIIQVLSVTDGLADIDVVGSGATADADSLSELGFTDAERQRLAETYAVGKTLWRVPMSHFTTYDCNWAVKIPDDAIAHNQGDAGEPEVTKTCDDPTACYIERENQVTRESAAIPGTPFILNYSSARAAGRVANYIIEIPLSGTTVPDSLKRIELEVNVAGQQYTQSFEATVNQKTAYTWDGKDSYGRTVTNIEEATVKIGYVYDGVYQDTSSFSATGDGITLSIDTATYEITVSQSYTVTLGTCPDGAKEIDGWSLNVHHFYDSTGKTLYLGDGSKRSAEKIAEVITTVVGTGEYGYSGDGASAVEAVLGLSQGLAVGADGSIYIADSSNHRIRRVNPDGIISTVVGTGENGYSGDGGLATQAQISWPIGLAIGPDGSIYIADSSYSVIRRVNTDGIITTVAGTPEQGYSGDGGLATQAKLKCPYGVAVDSKNDIYISDTGNDRIRRVGTDGIITTVAGTGEYGYSGDGDLAVDAKLNIPHGIAVGYDDSIYIADICNSRIRRVGTDGIITTVAGTGECGNSSDGGLAVEAKLNNPNGIVIGFDNSIYITDSYSYRIRKVSPDGIITTLAGVFPGQYNYSGDNGPAIQAELQFPEAVALGVNGEIYFSEWSYRIRHIADCFSGFTTDEQAIVSEDGTEIYQFDASGRHLKTQDAATGKVLYTFGYGDDGKLTSITDREGNVTTITRSGDQTIITAPFGQQTTLTANSDGYLQTITNPANETRSYSYADGGLLATITDPKGQSYQFTYDSLGMAVKQSNPDGGSITLERSDLDLGYQVQVTETQDDSNNSITTFSVETLTTGETRRKTVKDGVALETKVIDTDGGTETTTLADGTVTAITYGADPHFGVSGMQAPIITEMTVTTPAGLTYSMTGSRTVTLSDSDDPFTLLTQTDTITVNDKTATSVYDVTAKTVTATSPEGRTTVTTLDELGRVVKTEVAGLAPVAFTYDSYGRLATVTSSSGTESRTSTISYNSQGYVAGTTDPLSQSTQFTYDSIGRVTTQTLPDGQQINFSYDANGNVTTLTPPDKPAHGFSYTPMDLEDTYTPPDVGAGNNITQYSYNLAQQPTLLTRPDGQTVGFAYDTQGRLLNVTLPSGETLTYSYDATTRNLTSLAGSDGETLTFSYDGSLPTQTTWTGTVAGSVGYTYDNDFKVTAQTVNGANSISYTYDNDGLLTGAGSLSITRNTDNGLLTGTTLGNVTDSVTYNDFGETTEYQALVSGSTAFDSQCAYDSLGRIVSKTEVVGSDSHIYRYVYDSVGQLTDVYKDGSLDSHYAYDANGNRTAYSGTSNSVAVTIYDDQDRLTKYGDNSYTYTANGELLTKTDSNGMTTYEYDALGNLDAVTLTDGTKITYLTDGANRRIGKQVNGTLTKGFLYQDGLNPVAELDSSNNVVARFAYGTRANVPDYMVKDGVTYRIISDHLGSVRLVVNSSTGDIVQKMEYDEFGRVLSDSNPGFQPFGYAGGIYDPQTGLVRFGARDYDSETGRWTAKDPIGFNGRDANLYGYVLGDPINYLDLLGTDTYGLGISGSVNCGKRISGQAMLVTDEQGNIGISLSLGLGGGTPSVGLSGTYQQTTAENIDQLKGWSSEIGGSVNILGASTGGDKILGQGYTGYQVNVGGKLNPVPWEFHGERNHAWVFKLPFNWKKGTEAKECL